MKLNLGCKHHKLDGFINIDRDINCKPDLVSDVRKLDYPDYSIDEIYAGHLIEHFDCIETPKILEEWVRVLRVGGKLIMSFPDFEKVKDLWVQGVIGIEHINKFIFANEKGECQTHKQVVSLRVLKHYYNFEEIKGCPYVASGDMNWQTIVQFIKK